MRPVLVTDLLYAGRALLRVKPEMRIDKALKLIENAERADRFRRVTGMRHRGFGDGTLAGAAQASGLVPEPEICDPDFARGLIVVLRAIVLHGSYD